MLPSLNITGLSSLDDTKVDGEPVSRPSESCLLGVVEPPMCERGCDNETRLQNGQPGLGANALCLGSDIRGRTEQREDSKRLLCCDQFEATKDEAKI